MDHCKHEWKIVGSVVILLYLVSCAAQPAAVRFAPVYVTDRARFMLLPAAEIAGELDGPQQFTGSFGGREFIMDAWVRANARGIDMSLYNSLGADMGQFAFSDEGAVFQSPVFPPSFKAEYLAADFQFCFFRPEALREALETCGLSFELSGRTGADGEHTEIRRISEGSKIIIEIEKTANQVRYTNFLRSYAYTLSGAW